MTQVPVLIAGGGPVGMTLALELASRGVRCTVIERNRATTKHPKMDITNGRSVELFRRLGLVPALRRVAVPEDHGFDVSWVTTMAGHELHRFRYPTVVEARQRILDVNDGTQSLEPPMRVSQVEIEPVLKDAIDAHPNVDVRFGVVFESFDEDDDGVTAVVRDESGTTERVRCSYLVGCDGAGSRVRTMVQIGLSGSERIMQRFMTHFRSRHRELLQRWGVAWHYQSVHGTLIAQNDIDLWTLHTRVPAGVDVDRVDPRELVAHFVGARVDCDILVANPWVPHLVVAESYGRGRVFIAGDAAHQYIPTGGYGMNTGIGDAVDLGWKLAAVLKGFGGPRLLASFEAERRPVGLRNCAGSRRHNDVRVAIGDLYRHYGPLLEEAASAGEAARAEAARQIRRMGNLENESFGLEFGYCYHDSPVVWAETATEAPNDPDRYEPTTVPGARLPSVILANGEPLYDRLGPWLTLVTFSGSDGAEHLANAAERLGVPLQTIEMAERGLEPIYQAKMLLVRPDQHVAWRGHSIGGRAAADAILLRVLGF